MRAQNRTQRQNPAHRSGNDRNNITAHVNKAQAHCGCGHPDHEIRCGRRDLDRKTQAVSMAGIFEHAAANAQQRRNQAGTVHQHHSQREALHLIGHISSESTIGITRIQPERTNIRPLSAAVAAPAGSPRREHLLGRQHQDHSEKKVQKRHRNNARQKHARSAPSVVAVSSTIASLMLVSPALRNGAALPHEQAITETMLAAMAL